MRWEKTAVYHIEIMHFVGATVQIQHRSRWVFSKPTGSDRTSYQYNWNMQSEIFKIFVSGENAVAATMSNWT